MGANATTGGVVAFAENGKIIAASTSPLAFSAERGPNSRLSLIQKPYPHPLVAPQVSHRMQAPLRTRVKAPQLEQGSPSYPFWRAWRTFSSRAATTGA